MPSLTTSLLPFLVFLCLPWIAYWDCLFGTWVSDDCVFSGPEAKPISLYDGVQQKPISWHTLFKRLRYFFGRIPNPDRKWKEKKQLPFLPHPVSHHRFNLWVFTGVLILLYSFLNRIVGQSAAFLTTLLFAVHPLGGQTIGWISGIGYPTGTLFMLAGLNFVYLTQDFYWMTTPMGVLGSLLGYTFLQWMAVEAWFGTIGAVAILLWMKQYPFAIIASLFALYQCFHTFKEALDLRRHIFKEQQMEQSTKFYPKKLIVAMKTLYYNTKLAFFPKRMGLYHLFCYHYELPYVEQEDRYFIFGIGILLATSLGIWKGPTAVSLGCLWLLSFMFLFLNWITANQFVVDRYVWLPALGACLLVVHVLPPWAYWMIFGIALMRLWTHLLTYKDEFNFYVSNLINFPGSEVAWGNMGCTWMNQGSVGTSMDCWYKGTLINPDYDVNWYNLSSSFKMRGMQNPNYMPLFFSQLPKELLNTVLQQDLARAHLHLSRYCLTKALSASTTHFPTMWKKELDELNQILARPAGALMPAAQLVRPLLTAALT